MEHGVQTWISPSHQEQSTLHLRNKGTQLHSWDGLSPKRPSGWMVMLGAQVAFCTHSSRNCEELRPGQELVWAFAHVDLGAPPAPWELQVGLRAGAHRTQAQQVHSPCGPGPHGLIGSTAWEARGGS